jgi:hypothetical protein
MRGGRGFAGLASHAVSPSLSKSPLPYAVVTNRAGLTDRAPHGTGESRRTPLRDPPQTCADAQRAAYGDAE